MGSPYLGEPETEEQPDRAATALENRLRGLFQGDNYTKGLFQLATAELETVLPSDFDFLRTFAKNYLTRLCHLPELGNIEKTQNDLPAIPSPSNAESEFFLLTAPPMPGDEYLNADTLNDWWKELDHYVRSQIKKHPAGAVDWIQKQSPLWRTVGRVTFHLAENKRDESRPFAFMATYTDKVSAGAKPVQLPLSKALTEYASAQDRNSLLRLLQPINTAAEKCDWVQDMVEEQTIYQPRAWSPKQAYKLLQDIPTLEESGLIVRVPDWWKGKQTSRPQVRVSVGTKDQTVTCGADALLQFRIETVLGDEPLTEEELRELLAAGDTLVPLRGEWVEVDTAKLQAALDHWKKIDRLVNEDGLTFYEGMRLLSGLPVDGKWDGLGKELSFRDWSDVMPIGSFAEALTAIRDPSQVQDDVSYQQIGLNATLRPYQEVGVRWLHLLTRLELGACLADDMGLEKTIQVITLLLALKQMKTQPSLLVTPASLLGNWESEMKKFAPSLKSRIAHASGAGTDEPRNLHNIDLVMTTYGMVERIDWIKTKHFR